MWKTYPGAGQDGYTPALGVCESSTVSQIMYSAHFLITLTNAKSIHAALRELAERRQSRVWRKIGSALVSVRVRLSLLWVVAAHIPIRVGTSTQQSTLRGGCIKPRSHWLRCGMTWKIHRGLSGLCGMRPKR